MKRVLIFLFLLSLILPFSSGGSVGITPTSFNEFFEPEFEKEYTFRVFNADSEDPIAISLKGDLAEFSNLSKNITSNGGSFIVSLKLPTKLEKPGEHELLITATEVPNQSEATVSGIASIQARISVFVPYPGQYIEATFSVKDVNSNEDAPYDLYINNLGTESVTISPEISLFERGDSENIRLKKELEQIVLETKKSVALNGTINTSILPPGTYNLTATLTHYNVTKFERTLRVGQKIVEILDYDYQFISGKINPFNILIQSKWNSIIDPSYAEVTITDNGKVVGKFRTISDNLQPWEIKNLTGFFDAGNLEAKRYLANIFVHYEDLETSKLVAIYLENPPVATDYRMQIIIALSSLGIVLVLALFYLARKIHRLKKDAGGKSYENKK